MLFLFEEYIYQKISQMPTIDVLIVSSSCVHSYMNTKIKDSMYFSSDTFFKIFTKIAVKMNSKLIFIPHLILEQDNLNSEDP